MALPWHYHGCAPIVVSAQFRCISEDPLGVGGERGLVVAVKLVVSAQFRFVSDDPLGVGGWNLCSKSQQAKGGYRCVCLADARRRPTARGSCQDREAACKTKQDLSGLVHALQGGINPDISIRNFLGLLRLREAGVGGISCFAVHLGSHYAVLQWH